MKIFLNPGHSLKYDPGAIGANGTKECEINAKIAKATAERLQAAGHDVIVYQQQKRLADVAEMANASGASLFVSIHCNSAVNKQANGTETWHYTGCPVGKKFATKIQLEIIKAIGTRNRGVKNSRSLYVLRKTTMPAVLVETGFLSNPAEEKLLNAKTAEIGEAIAKGIISAM